MQNNPDAIREAMRLANTPAGKQLIAMLQQNGGEDLQRALQSASSGDYTQAKNALHTLISNPEVRKLLGQMGGNYGPDGR